MQRSKAPWFKAFLPLLVLSLTACLPINADVPDLTTFLSDFLNPGFIISPNPKELTTTQGGSAAIQLTIAPDNDFPGGTVNLKLVNPPNGVSLSPSNVRVGSYKVTKTLTIYTTADTPVGRHTLTLEATSGKIRRNTTLTLTVKQAPTFTVNTTADTIDTRPGDGTCADIEGKCSLRAAVMEANSLTTPVVIIIPAGTYKLTHISRVAEQGGDLDITNNVTLKGAGAGQTILDGNGTNRVLEIHKGTVVRVEGVTIQNGVAENGGGIYNAGTLTLKDSIVSGNSANGSFFGVFDGDGGGIFNAGALTLTNSTVSGNKANEDGGGIFNDGALILMNSIVSGNKANKDGGGIFNDEGATLTLTNSTVNGNMANDSGGGIFNDRELFNAGALTLTNSTVSGNKANEDGGGIYSAGALTLTNSTVNGNMANDSGGGIYSAGALTLTNSTVSGNVAKYGGGVYVDKSTANLSFSTLTLNQASAGGGIYIHPGTVKLKGVILAGNASKSGPECNGSLISLGYNLIESNVDCGFTAQSSDILNQGPALGPLAAGGGPTKTHLPQAGSPVLDKVPSGDCTDLEGKALATDQRGVKRPQGTACDIGAVERKPSE